MAKVFGTSYTREELLKRVGDIAQISGISIEELTEGRAKGIQVANIWTGSGLEFSINLSRGMSIGAFRYRGIPFSWISATGDVAPWYYEPGGEGLDRSYAGGLMHLAGLRQVGAPCKDENEDLGLHGRICNIPAEKVYEDGYWDGDEYRIILKGILREVRALGENVVLRRTITTALGGNEITIEDQVINAGQKTTPHMILYHTNFGFPLIDKDSRLMIASKEVTDAFTGKPVPNEVYSRFTEPKQDAGQQIYFHNTHEHDGWSGFILANNNLKVGLQVDYLKKNLPELINWVNLEAGRNVVEVGPANCKCFGRAAERESGTLQFLEPGEVRDYIIKFKVLDGLSTIDEAELALIK